MVNDACQSFTWVLEASKPVPVVAENASAATFTANKIVTQNKGTDEAQVEYAKTLIAALKVMTAYVKANHMTGLVWNSKPSASAAAVPPPPPPSGKLPPPPPPPAGSFTKNKAADTTGVSQLFAEIRAKGDNITSGLKHVDNSQKVYKQVHRDVRDGVEDAFEKAKQKNAAKKRSWEPKAGAASMRLEGKRWILEYQTNPANDGAKREITVDASKPQVVYLYRSKDVRLLIGSKCNTVQLVECLNVEVSIAGTVGPLEVTNCEQCEFFLADWVPNVIFSKVKNAMVQFGPGTDVTATDFVTSCTSGINISHRYVNAKTEEQEDVEVPLPEQYESNVVGNKVVTKAVEHSS
jgi:hypothetical protein